MYPDDEPFFFPSKSPPVSGSDPMTLPQPEFSVIQSPIPPTFPDDEPYPSEYELKQILREEHVKAEPSEESLAAPQPLELLHSTQIPPFLSKTFDIVDNRILDPIISWGPSGASFVVWDPVEFARVVLPRNFKHNNFSSFVRQLNTYGFRKIDTDKWEFANEGFVRGKKHLLKSIQRRRSPQAQQIGPHVVGSLSEFSKEEEIKGELEKLRKEKSSMMKEVVELQQQQHGTVRQMEAVNEKLQVAEQRQKKMVSFLANLLQNREFLARLQHKEDRKALTAPRKASKFLKCQNEPYNLSSPKPEQPTINPEFKPPSVEGTSHFFTKSAAEITGSVSRSMPIHTGDTVDKGKNVASLKLEDDPKYFVSFPEELGDERNFPELSSLGIGSVVKQEDLWNMGFEDEAGMLGSSAGLGGSFSNYDVAELGISSSLSDVWDLGSWPVDDSPSDELGGQQKDDSSTNLDP